MSQLNFTFSKTPIQTLSSELSDYACVALILRTQKKGLEIAFIRRAHKPQDHWSGQIAFPGGRKEIHDPHDLGTAVRETEEEVGWLLNESHHQGFLTDVRVRNRTGMLQFFLRPLVFYIESDFPKINLNPEEVDAVFWVPIETLEDESNRTTLFLPDRELTLPGIKLPSGDTLWGLTYIVTQELLSMIKKSGANS